MAIIKCKMCGGDLNVEENSQIAVCEYCGTQQTVPKQDNEKKLTLFARANRLRFACEFDKAAGVYESIVAEFPEEAEAYWGLVLCKYGIEYVDDPATGKKVPTCHRSSFDSVLEDANFELVMEYADVVTRKLYREEAKAIEELRRGIIEVSSREEPYDIFICYKETDENGQRTLDSVLAQDLYDALTEKGYRVFFSRITLEDKLGQEYEPYIFAALNSARVMLAVGTDYEYYNAPWVKNEWSRYLQLIAAGQKKSLIPCYKNIDAYDMPKEFAKLQAQDLGKVGATQDLLRGVEKLFGKNNEQKGAQSPTSIATAPNTDALLRRGHLFLEDKDWENADTYFDKVLDFDPECADAYLGKLLVQLRITSANNISCNEIALPDDFGTIEEMGCYKKTEKSNKNCKGDSIMKIAVTYENGQIFQHFGHTEQFKLYEAADGKITHAEVVDTNGSGHGALAGFLMQNGVDTLICGGIGGGAQAALAEAGIKLYGGVSGDADAAVNALLSGNLGYNPNVHCDHHDHEHGEAGHTCGDHGCGKHSCH